MTKKKILQACLVISDTGEEYKEEQEEGAARLSDSSDMGCPTCSDLGPLRRGRGRFKKTVEELRSGLSHCSLCRIVLRLLLEDEADFPSSVMFYHYERNLLIIELRSFTVFEFYTDEGIKHFPSCYLIFFM